MYMGMAGVSYRVLKGHGRLVSGFMSDEIVVAIENAPVPWCVPLEAYDPHKKRSDYKKTELAKFKVYTELELSGKEVRDEEDNANCISNARVNWLQHWCASGRKLP